MNRAQGSLSACFHPMSNSSPFPPIGQWRALVPEAAEAAVVQRSPTHHVPPLIRDRPIQESFHSNRREGYVSRRTAQDDELSAMRQWSSHTSRHRSSTTSRNPNAPDAHPTTTATDVPPTRVSRSPSFSPAQGTSHVEVIENRPPLIRFTDHNSAPLNRTTGNPTLYPLRGGMYWILA